MAGPRFKIGVGILRVDATAQLHAAGEGVQSRQRSIMIAGTERDNVAAVEAIALVKVGIVGGGLGGLEIDDRLLSRLIAQRTTHDLDYSSIQ